MSNAPGRNQSVQRLGSGIFAAFCFLSLIWPMGNIADNYGGDRGPGNTGVVAAIWAVGSILVYLSQRLRWGSRSGPAAAGPASLEIRLAALAGLVAIHIGLWTGSRPHSLGLLFAIAGVASVARSIWIDWDRLGPFERALSVAADVILASAAGTQLVGHGFSDLGFSKRTPVPDPAAGMALWYLLATVLPVVLAVVLAVRAWSRR